MVRGATVSGGGRAGVCLLTALTRSQYPILVDPVAGGFARTDITYTLEWNPTLAAP